MEIFNDGPPLNTEETEHLFAPFYSTKVAGTGFGLTIARLLARKHYGKIDLHPVAERGHARDSDVAESRKRGWFDWFCWFD